MIKLSYRFSILIILIIIIIITLTFCKYSDEYFLDKSRINLMPSIYFNNEKFILLLHKNNENVKTKIFEEFSKTTLNKSNNFYYSNVKIYNESDIKNGFMIKPFNLLNNILIGLHHFEEKEIDNEKIISNLNFAYQINNKNIKIHENGVEQIIDFCKDPNIRLCKSNKDFSLSQDNYLGIFIHNSYIHYVIINNTKDYQQGLLIHRSEQPIKYPLNMCIINKKQNNIFKDILWLSSNTSSPIDYPWTVDYLKRKRYEAIPLPKKKPLNRVYDIVTSPSFDEPEEEDPFYNLPDWAKKIEILDTDRNSDIITIKLKFHKIDQLYLNNMYQIQAKIWAIDDKNKNKLIIPLNKKDFKLKNNVVENIQIDLSNYGNIFYEKKIKIQVIGVISQFANDKFNLNSNTVSL